MTATSSDRFVDHLVLTVKDLDATVRFYENVMGMRHTSFTSTGSPDVARHALSFGTQKINLHIAGQEFEPKAQVGSPHPLLDLLCSWRSRPFNLAAPIFVFSLKIRSMMFWASLSNKAPMYLRAARSSIALVPKGRFEVSMCVIRREFDRVIALHHPSCPRP